MDIGSAILAGLIATAVMTTLMYLARAMGMEMDMPRILGLMFAGPDHTGAVYLLGLMAHIMMGAIFGLVYAALFEWLGIGASLLWGSVFGLVHGVVAGMAMAMAMAMMPAMHPRMGNGQVLSSPGPFAINWGAMLPIGLIVLHVIFGVTFAAIY